MSSPDDPPPPRTREVDLGPTPLPLALELPSRMPRSHAGAVDRTDRARGDGGRSDTNRWLAPVVVVFVILAAAAAGAVVWLLPWYVRRVCVEEAEAHGITLTVDDAALGQGGFYLLGLRATAAALPGAAAQAPRIEVETRGLRPERMTVHGAVVTLSGSWAEVDAALSSWRASPQGGQGGAWAPGALRVEASRLVWQGAFAENARVEASSARLDLSWLGTSATTVRASSDDVTVVVPAGKLGPWRVDFDRSPGTSRVRVALDPGVPDACTVLVVGDDERTISVDAVIPRSPLARLGLSPSLLGLHGKALQLAVTAHYGAVGAQRGEATSSGGLYGIEAGLPIALDVAWDGTAGGDSNAGLDVRKARLAVGPLVGALTGVLKTFDDGFRVDLAWAGGPVPCAAFDAPLGAGNPFDVAYQLRKLAEGVGLTHGVTGDVRARGVLSFDSRDLGAVEVTFVPEVKCAVSLFGP